MKTRITIKKYVFDENASWEERYQQLEKHHVEETTFLIKVVTDLENALQSSSRSWQTGVALLGVCFLVLCIGLIDMSIQLKRARDQHHQHFSIESENHREHDHKH